MALSSAACSEVQAGRQDTTARRTRITWIDTAKGFGIILVVFEHVVRGLVDSRIATWTPITQFDDVWIYTFHMPLFFFLSGLFICHSLKKGWTSFAWDKVCTIAYPYLLWSAITVLGRTIFARFANTPSHFSDLTLLLYKPVAQYWFLYVLFILLLVVSALLKFGLRPWMIAVISVLFYPGVLPIPYYWGVQAMTSSNAIYVAAGAVVGSSCDLTAFSRISDVWVIVAAAVGLSIAALGAVIDLSHLHADSCACDERSDRRNCTVAPSHQGEN